MSTSNINIKSGFAWTTFDKISSQVVQLFISIIIARLVTPSDYGILGILMTFIIVSQVIIESGFGSALIYKNNKDIKDLETASTFTLIISIILLIIIFLSAPFVESFFSIEDLANSLRISSLVLLPNALIVVPTSILKIDLAYKPLAVCNIISTIVSGILGVILAYWDYGYWALVIQMLSRSFIHFILVSFYSKWIPKFLFNKYSFISLYKYGIGIFGASFITKLVDESTTFFVGKLLTPFSLGIYSRANQFAGLPSTTLVTIITSVIFPSLSSLKNNEEQFNQVFKKSIAYLAAISIPFFLWLSALSEPIIRIVLTDKWIEAIPVMQVLCVGRCLYPIANISEQAINAKGRSDLFFKQQIIKISIKAIAMIILIRYGLFAVAIADALYTSTQFFVTCWFLKKVSSYTLIEQLKSLWIYLFAGVISAILAYIIVCAISNDYLSLLLALTTAMISYCLIISILKAPIRINNTINIKKLKYERTKKIHR